MADSRLNQVVGGRWGERGAGEYVGADSVSDSVAGAGLNVAAVLKWCLGWILLQWRSRRQRPLATRLKLKTTTIVSQYTPSFITTRPQALVETSFSFGQPGGRALATVLPWLRDCNKMRYHTENDKVLRSVPYSGLVSRCLGDTQIGQAILSYTAPICQKRDVALQRLYTHTH